MKLKVLLAAGVALGAVPAMAQETPARPRADIHDEATAQIVVTARYVDNLDILAGTSVLSGTDLAQSIRPQLGDTLTALPGVSATSFSPGASRPVLRGFQGGRVAVLTDGIGGMDASSTSADHAVTIDPLTSYRIEVLRGPAALLYGSQAIGGAVNVLDRRIPRQVPDEPVHVDALADYASASDLRSIAGAADMPLTARLVAHVDGSYRKTGDLDVGGYVLAPSLRAEQLTIANSSNDPVIAAEARRLVDQRGSVPNTATETWTAGGGLAFIDERGSLGASFSYYNSDYGIPERPPSEPGAGEIPAPVTIGLRQFRADLRGEIDVGGGFLDSVSLRLGYSNYDHTEFEGDEVGTVFLVDGVEGRLEFIQADRGGWRGVTGVQAFARSFDAIGEEAFVPRNATEQVGLFTLQEFEFGALGIEAAGRYERSLVGAPAIGVERSFDALSGALGASYQLNDDLKIGVNLSRSERAPTAEELFSNGPHVATQAFEVGDPDFTTEKSIGLESYVRGEAGPLTFSLTGFISWFDDFILDRATGEIRNGLPVFQFFQSGATHYGFEGEASMTLAEIGAFRINTDLVADYVHATIDGGGPIPRIPPLRLLGGLEAQSDNFDARIEVEHAFAQNRIAVFETPTDGFTLANLSLAWRPWGRANTTALFASVNNIFDVEARRHASFTKDFVPMPGRDVRVGARVTF